MTKIITAQQRAARWKGLGDAVASATRLVGIRPCSACKARQEALNRLVPFSTKTKTPPSNPSHG
jgi:hypothetical protein